MNSLFAGNIVLSEMESESLMSSLQNPNREYIDFRDDIFRHADESISIRTEGTGYVADIPELDLSFLDNQPEVSAEVVRDRCDSYETISSSTHSSVKWEGQFQYDLFYSFNSVGEMISSVYSSGKKPTESSTETDSIKKFAA